MSRISFVLLVVLALLWLLVGDLPHALPPDRVLILAGPAGGSFDQHAHRYQAQMQAQGLHVEVRNEPDSLRIIDRVQDAGEGLHIGFTAQGLDDPGKYKALASAGVVELQPLFLFLRAGAPQPPTLQGLAGLRLAMPPPGSATARAAREVLAAYGVTEANAHFVHRPLDDVPHALARGDADAAIMMLAPDNTLVQRLATDPAYSLYGFHENVALSRQITYLKPTLLARGGYDLRRVLPPADVPMVGARINVVVRRDLHPAALYALLRALDDAHKTQTLVSNAGDFPTLAGTVLEPHPLAVEWSKSGTPWLFSHLPPLWAGLIDAYWGPTLFLLAAVSFFGTLGSVSAFVESVALNVALVVLALLQAAVDRGLKPGRFARLLFRVVEPVVRRSSAEDLVRQRLERLRPLIPS